MSKGRIEKEIVQLMFDAKDFAKGIKNSIDDLSQLKKGMDMSTGVKAFGDLEKASEVDMSPLSNSLDGISYKMIALSTAAGIMLADIAKSVVASAKKMVDALVLTPITTGLEEYETQINAVQVILANTAKAGTTLSDVTEALDELNLYADLTIYNFTEMTKNIGTFTAAGVELGTSVSAIKGIANLAAVSGSSSVQAATGMYQLSQAISSGTVKLMDWNSVQNAGMGGAIFQESLLETARVHGIAVDNIIKSEGSFRDSLTKGWLSSEVLLETLSKFTGDLTSEQLTQMGYTETQIGRIIELGEMANDAATKIKTLTALKDTLNEALQSGWAVSWRLILGDFEQAKILWGDVADFFSEMIEASSKSRNEMLQTWSDVGGRAALIKGFFNVMEAGKNILSAFGEALGAVFKPFTYVDLFQLTFAFLKFSEKIKMGSENLGWFKSIIKGVASVLKIIGLAVRAVLFPFKFLVPIVELAVKAFVLWLALQGEIIYRFTKFAEETDYFGKVVKLIIIYLKLFAEIVEILVEEFFNLKQVKEVIAWFEEMVLPLLTLENLMKTLRTALTAVVAPFYLLAIGARELYEEMLALEEVQEFLAWLNDLSLDPVVEAFDEISASIAEIIEEVKGGELVGKFLDYFATFDGRRIKQLFADGEEGFSWAETVLSKIKGTLEKYAPTFEEVKDSLRGILETIGAGLGNVLDYLINDAQDLDYTGLFNVINAGLLSGLILSIRSVFTGGWFSDSDIGEGLADVVEGLGDTLGTFQNNIRADTLQKIAISIALLAGSITLLALIPQDKLLSSSAAIAVMVTALFGSAGALRTIKPQDAIKAATAIIGLSVAVAIFAVALKTVGDLDPEESAVGLGAMVVGLSAMVLSMKGLSKTIGPDIVKSLGTLMALALTLSILVGVIRRFGELDPEKLAQGMLAVGATLTMLTYALMLLGEGSGGSKLKAGLALTAVAVALKKLIPIIEDFGEMDKEQLIQGLAVVGVVLYGLTLFSQALKTDKLLEGAAGILVISAALFVMVEVIKEFGGMDWKELVQGLLAVAAVLAILVIAANAMQGTLAGAAAILVMSIALAVMAGVLYVLSDIDWKDLGKALLVIAGVFVILGVAGYLLAPVVPILMLLGIAMALIGVGALMMGGGLFLAALGLVAIAGSAVGIAKAIRVVGSAVIDILPDMATAIANAIGNFVVTIAERAPEIATAFKDIIIAMITAVTELIPEMVAAILLMIVGILEAIAENIDDIVQAGYDILLALIEGVADNIDDVVEAGFSVLTEFLAGIAKGLPDLVDQAFELILTFLESIEDAIDEYLEDIIAAGISIGVAIVDGVAEAIRKGAPKVKSAVWSLVKAALNALGLGFLTDSPSKRTYWYGTQVVRGFVNAIDDGQRAVSKAMGDFARSAQDGLSPVLQAMNDEIDKELILEPVIRPVLDADMFRKDVDKFKQVAGTNLPIYNLASDLSRPVGHWAAPADTSLGRAGATTFIQNNYSPKALDRADIYRQTRTQVARLSARELE